MDGFDGVSKSHRCIRLRLQGRLYTSMAAGISKVSVVSGKMASETVRYTWQQSPDITFYGYLCRLGTHGRATEGFRSYSCASDPMPYVTTIIARTSGGIYCHDELDTVSGFAIYFANRMKYCVEIS